MTGGGRPSQPSWTRVGLTAVGDAAVARGAGETAALEDLNVSNTVFVSAVGIAVTFNHPLQLFGTVW